jgi:hypothetical protein
MNMGKHTALGVTGLVCIFSVIACADPAESQTSSHKSKTNQPQQTQDDTSSNDPQTLDSAPTGDGTSSGAPAPTQQQTQDQALKCGSVKKDACMTCCNMAYPQMQTAFRNTLAKCVCQDPGECASSCGDNYCAGQQSTQACATCIQTSQTCGPATIALCESSAPCAAYLTCLDSCH